MVYAFASILATYLVSTFIGLQIYRLWSRKNRREGNLIWVLLGLFALLPLLAANPGIHVSRLLRLIVGIAPFSGVLGFLTPLLVDRWSGGDPGKAGKAYAVNILGCILGPLLSGFLLLPLISERWVLFVFSLPWLLMAVRPAGPSEKRFDWQAGVSYAVVLSALALVFTQKSYEDQFGHSEVLRDNTATIVAMGKGRNKHLLVNGVGITGLTPITKFMAHLPLAFLDHPPKSALVVCFGMGHHLPFPAVMGHSGNRGGVGAKRSTRVRVLSRRWSRYCCVRRCRMWLLTTAAATWNGLQNNMM